jgi:hypothetical protein
MIDPVAATVAAVVAAQLMEAPAYLQRALGMRVRQDIFDEGGSILRAPERWRGLAGWVGHAALAIAIVLLFATFFAAVAGNDHLAGGACLPARSILLANFVAAVSGFWAGWFDGRAGGRSSLSSSCGWWIVISVLCGPRRADRCVGAPAIEQAE